MKRADAEAKVILKPSFEQVAVTVYVAEEFQFHSERCFSCRTFIPPIQPSRLPILHCLAETTPFSGSTVGRSSEPVFSFSDLAPRAGLVKK